MAIETHVTCATDSAGVYFGASQLLTSLAVHFLRVDIIMVKKKWYVVTVGKAVGVYEKWSYHSFHTKSH